MPFHRVDYPHPQRTFFAADQAAAQVMSDNSVWPDEPARVGDIIVTADYDETFEIQS